MSIVTRVLASGAQKILLATVMTAAATCGVANAATNLAPKISGTPATTATVGIAYSFTASASDPEGKWVSFGIRNKPAWATFDRYTGQLRGKPTAAATFSGIQIYAWDGVKAGTLPTFSIKVSTSGTANSPPKISGTPPTSATVGTTYSFRPTASDPDGNALGFSITNRPAWATFSTSTGQLSGKPTAAGTFSNITIKVGDGTTTATLPAFAITVKAASGSTANGAATLSWTPPTTNTNGSSLTNLSGFRIYYGTSSSALTQTILVSNASVSTYVVESLSPATYYFAVKAVTTTGLESALSNIASKTVQ